jgi:hypothetical protein
MVRGKGIQASTLSASELADLKGQREEIAETLKAADGTDKFGAGTRAEGIDRVALQRQDNRLRDAIDAGSPKRLTGNTKDRMAKEVEELEESIKAGMPTLKEMEDPRHHPGAERKHLNWERKNIHNILKWKDLKRQLNPDDPTCSSVEILRQK